MEIAGLDLSILVEEFSELEDGFVQKVYQRDDELTLEVYVPGEDKKRLIIGPSYAFISKYKRDNPERPPGFAMELRKHLGRVDAIKQKGFDRILEIESGDEKLVAELFGRGNLVLLDSGKIIGALRQEEYADRSVVVGEEYEYPEPAADPRGTKDFFDLMEDGEVVRRIATDLGLGGTYAEEACARAGVGKNRDVGELEKDEREAINSAIRELFEARKDARLYLEGGEPVRAAPFELETYERFEEELFGTFSRTLDEHFYRQEKQKEEKKHRKAFEEKKGTLERKKEQQEHKVQGLEEAAEEKREKAELIYEDYQRLHDIKQSVEEGLEKHGWKETEKRLRESEKELSKAVKNFNEREGFYIVETSGRNIKLRPEENLEATASRYYDSAKESEDKLERAREALEKTREELEELEEEDVEVEVMEDKTRKRSKKWFEKYRWFYSSEGFLVVIGRDAQTNEMLVKKHMESNDLYFHADFDGAPSVVVKEGREAGEETLQEAAKAAVTFSKTWKAGIRADDVYHVDPGQVTKDPESGEYLGKGAFVIRGDREYTRNVSVEAAIGPYEIEGHEVPMCGPVEAVKENCPASIELEPGRVKKSELAKDIQERFREQGHELDLDYIIRALPPGKSGIKD